MKVECYDETGAEVYDMVVRQILQDLQITRAVKDLRVYVDPREPLFIIVVSYEKTSPPVSLMDIAEYDKDRQANEVFLKIRDETYLPELLSKLWEIEGRNKIHQSSRYEVIVDDPRTDIKNLVVYNPEEDLRKKIYDALFRIIPEGLRVVDHYSEGNIIALTASDEPIKDEWLVKTQEVVKNMKASEGRFRT
ncbi:MAG TPA: methanogenesis marker 17 protein [Methanobacterium sp.]|jgi:putative methanogenesis marker protein 17|nr:MAG: methanogenesis marker 17 protein [Methanobacterium sp.]HOI70781.1 methanogenesis marker 17 protein [Methanobacterium sp.]HPX77966.1 methanogenesis marker 17 protein [Methanobacterium sp.]